MSLKKEKSLDCIEINPKKPAQKSIIWLHGLGADGSDFVPIIPELKLPEILGIRFIFPHAPIRPITINNGYEMRAWYDISSLAFDGQIDESGILYATHLIEQLITKEIDRGIATKDILLAGFSQGAVIALTTGLRFTQSLAGIIALSGYLPLADKLIAQASPVNRHIPIFLAHGSEDAVVPYALGKNAYVTLKQYHYPVSWHSYPMPHSVCAAEMTDLSQWIQARW